MATVSRQDSHRQAWPGHYCSRASMQWRWEGEAPSGPIPAPPPHFHWGFRTEMLHSAQVGAIQPLSFSLSLSLSLSFSLSYTHTHTGLEQGYRINTS